MATVTISAGSTLSRQVHEFVLRDFTPHYGELDKEFGSDPLWRRFLELDTEMWLDSGNFEAVEGIWTREYSGLTTNNTLLNKEIETGAYNELIAQAADLLSQFPDLTEREFRLEMAFILNAPHALRLVERFDAHVCVEEHTDLAHDLEEAVEYARRYYAICPERFYREDPVHARGAAGDAAGPAGGHPGQPHAGVLRPAELRRRPAGVSHVRERVPGPAQQLHRRQPSGQRRLRRREGHAGFSAGDPLAAGGRGFDDPPDRGQLPLLRAVPEPGGHRRHDVAPERGERAAGSKKRTAVYREPTRPELCPRHCSRRRSGPDRARHALAYRGQAGCLRGRPGATRTSIPSMPRPSWSSSRRMAAAISSSVEQSGDCHQRRGGQDPQARATGRTNWPTVRSGWTA